MASSVSRLQLERSIEKSDEWHFRTKPSTPMSVTKWQLDKYTCRNVGRGVAPIMISASSVTLEHPLISISVSRRSSWMHSKVVSSTCLHSFNFNCVIMCSRSGTWKKPDAVIPKHLEKSTCAKFRRGPIPPSHSDRTPPSVKLGQSDTSKNARLHWDNADRPSFPNLEHFEIMTFAKCLQPFTIPFNPAPVINELSLMANLRNAWQCANCLIARSLMFWHPKMEMCCRSWQFLATSARTAPRSVVMWFRISAPRVAPQP